MNKDHYFISSYVHIRKSQIYKNGKLLYKSEANTTVSSFLKESYKELPINYPKFHKMDDLCKMGILSSSILLMDEDYSDDTGLVLSNASSSYNTDLKHQQTIQAMVSPAVFVYTLPNIVLGEISIKFGLKSENAFFIENEFNARLLYDYTSVLIDNNKAESVVCGWIEVKNDEYDVFLCLVTKKGAIPFSIENLKKLYLFENE